MRKQQQQQGEAAAGEERAPRKGHVPVLVGLGQELRRFTVRVEELRHPSFVKLLDMAAREFEYRQEGVLRIPCDEKRFRQVMQEITGKPVR
ncbi:hypothetical protein ZIOFF_021334 [Zingiber officinale]|uniref:Uncharacterized protein n=1 Tax=Zingiber officinale TaxID=94328 RepID=A0A8J5H6R1_ZINOF|nr:hypothetical protein ZIOFF_021334 [Zingiber officinale]